MIREYTLYAFNPFKFIEMCFLMSSVMMNRLCALKKNKCYAFIGCDVLERVIRAKWLILLFRSCFFTDFFLLLVLSIAKEGELKSPTMILELSVSPFNFVHFASCSLNLFLGTHTFMVAMTSSKLTLTSLQNVPLYLFLLKSTLSAINVATPAFLGSWFVWTAFSIH